MARGYWAGAYNKKAFSNDYSKSNVGLKHKNAIQLRAGFMSAYIAFSTV